MVFLVETPFLKNILLILLAFPPEFRSFSLRTVSKRKLVPTARLLKMANGRHELILSTADDHAAAREWCSLFHYVFLRMVPKNTQLVLAP